LKSIKVNDRSSRLIIPGHCLATESAIFPNECQGHWHFGRCRCRHREGVGRSDRFGEGPDVLAGRVILGRNVFADIIK
jgi:hypothetical protein